YGRGPGGEVWKIEDTLYDLVQACVKILSPDALFFLINSYTTGLAPGVLTYLLQSQIVPQFGGSVIADEIGLPVGNKGLVLPCGASGRWTRN
ncbi:MAG: SAM-dependent methyltransferase, partial [Lachnospiraceae bacterium]|nr:SAM-dependent methyltransferase [Lachnospiraceae bacterium]